MGGARHRLYAAYFSDIEKRKKGTQQSVLHTGAFYSSPLSACHIMSKRECSILRIQGEACRYSCSLSTLHSLGTLPLKVP
jgi:hypothetical protein